MSNNIKIMEAALSRLIQTETVGQERKRLTKMIVISIRELMKQSNPDSSTKDLAAFIALALEAVDNTIERTVAPWEKRNYWVKADKFRREWAWAQKLGEEMRQAVFLEDWGEVAIISAQVGAKLGKLDVSPRHRMGKPWIGAWDRLISKV